MQGKKGNETREEVINGGEGKWIEGATERNINGKNRER